MAMSLHGRGEGGQDAVSYRTSAGELNMNYTFWLPFMAGVLTALVVLLNIMVWSGLHLVRL